MVCGSEMSPMEMKEVGDLAVNRDETLTLPRLFEADDPPPSSSQRKMRIFGAVVQSLVRSMLNAGHQLSLFGELGASTGGLRSRKVPDHRCKPSHH